MAPIALLLFGGIAFPNAGFWGSGTFSNVLGVVGLGVAGAGVGASLLVLPLKPGPLERNAMALTFAGVTLSVAAFEPAKAAAGAIGLFLLAMALTYIGVRFMWEHTEDEAPEDEAATPAAPTAARTDTAGSDTATDGDADQA